MEINTKKEKQDFGKKVGIAEWKVLKFNPTRTELNKILGREDSDQDQEISYLGTSTEGYPYVRIDAWMKDVNSDYISKARFFVEDRDCVSMNGKTLYVNAVGRSSYVDSEANLADWFKKAMTYRVGKKGEKELMDFMRCWLKDIQLDVDNGGNKNNILLDVHKLMTGNVGELNWLATSEYAGSVVGSSIVRSGKDGKSYSGVFEKNFLPGYCIKYFGENDDKPKFVQEFISEISGKYGPKGYYTFDLLRDYREEDELPMETEDPIIPKKEY